jgi:thiol:disulfide interchange protein DsbC
VLPEEIFINYPSSAPNKYQITIFTDIDGPYCGQLHSHMPSFNQQGITVNYILLPRSGIASQSYKKTLSAICSADPAASITRAMQNHNREATSGASTLVSQHMRIAEDLQMHTTPTIVLANVQIKQGLVNPVQMLALLEAAEQ